MVKKKLLSENFFGQTKFLVKKNLVKKVFAHLKILFKKIFWLKKILVQNVFGFCQKNCVGLTLGRKFMTPPPRK